MRKPALEKQKKNNMNKIKNFDVLDLLIIIVLFIGVGVEIFLK